MSQRIFLKVLEKARIQSGLRYLSLTERFIRLIAIMLAVLCLAAFSQAGAQDSFIVGDCLCDSTANKTICEYTVFSRYPALSYLVFPIPAGCVEQFTVSSPYFTFDPPQAFTSPSNADVYGIRTREEPPEGSLETITITFDGICTLGTDLVQAATKTDLQWIPFPVPAVTDCAFQPDCHFALDYTRFDVYIRKPGTYAGCLATVTARSNLPMNITFASFTDLNPVQSFGSGQIRTFYAIAPPELTEPPAEFLAPADFNQQLIVIPDDEQEHQFSIWLKLMVSEQMSACEYENKAIIRVEIENLEDYIDPDLSSNQQKGGFIEENRDHE